jgi:hypothetical protein
LGPKVTGCSCRFQLNSGISHRPTQRFATLGGNVHINEQASVASTSLLRAPLWSQQKPTRQWLAGRVTERAPSTFASVVRKTSPLRECGYSNRYVTCNSSLVCTRPYRVQAHKQICVCPHVEEVHARKWKLDAPTQDTALYIL